MFYFDIEMISVFIIFLYEHLSVAMFDLDRKERSSIILQEVVNCWIMFRLYIIERCRLQVENATVSLHDQIIQYWPNFRVSEIQIDKLMISIFAPICFKLKTSKYFSSLSFYVPLILNCFTHVEHFIVIKWFLCYFFT